ncbi:MAG: class I SAM-dependent methyltransferase [Hyphomicrobiaceae bacterium]|nr:class I SAM-dependent methyltransferase [Hyphomicrobiaceae bacterium]
MTWIKYWNSKPSIYVSERHKAEHYRSLAIQISELVPGSTAKVLDYGCGEALAAREIAGCCGHLVLCDAAESVRRGLTERFRDVHGISVCRPEDLADDATGRFDLIVVNSLLQYLAHDELARCMAMWWRLLAPNGEVLFADIVPPDVKPHADAWQLLTFAVRHGFFLEAVLGLVRTTLSDYRSLRDRLGFTMLSEAEFMALTTRHGLTARRVHPNLGHNQLRMAFLARRSTNSAEDKP